MHADRVKGCTLYPDQCNNPYVAELRGAVDYATWNFLKKDVKVTYFAYGNTDRIEARRIQLTNADKTRTFAQMLIHENRLYIFEATVTADRLHRRCFSSPWASSTRTAGGFGTTRSTPTRIRRRPGCSTTPARSPAIGVSRVGAPPARPTAVKMRKGPPGAMTLRPASCRRRAPPAGYARAGGRSSRAPR